MKTAATLTALALTAAVSTAWAGPDATDGADTPVTPLHLSKLAPEGPAQDVVMSLRRTDGHALGLVAIASPDTMTWAWQYNDEGVLEEMTHTTAGAHNFKNIYRYNAESDLVGYEEHLNVANVMETMSCNSIYDPENDNTAYVESNLYAHLPLILRYHVEQGHEAFSAQLRGPQSKRVLSIGADWEISPQHTRFQMTGEVIGSETLEIGGEEVETQMILLALEPDEASDLQCETTYLQVFMTADGRILRLTAECGDAFAAYEAVTLPVDEAPAGDDEADE